MKIISAFSGHPFLVQFCSLLFICCNLNAQVSGTVKDAKTGELLPGVEVFINRSSILADTNEDGKFDLSIPYSGFVNLVLYKKGYKLYHSSMRVQPDRAYFLNLTLDPENKKAEPVKMTVTDNIQTGYRSISYFEKSPSENEIIRYKYLSPSGLRQSISWENKRKELYEGSLRHWLRAMVAGTTEEEGFEILSNSNSVSAKSLINPTSLLGHYRINLQSPIDVIYKNNRNKLSAVEALDVSELGILLNPKLLMIEGVMQRIDLPLDYEPIKGDVEELYTELMKRYYEKIYVHTDKPYYYQGEAIWFKAYVNYYYPQWGDSLSMVLYVELVSPEKKIVQEKILKIDSGFAKGDFILPDTLQRGDYYLRAYTNLQRNFRNESLYVKPIFILGITDKVDPVQAMWEPVMSERVTVKMDKEHYGTREKMVVTVDVTDKAGNQIAANLSVSVTDANQVLPVPTSAINEIYPIGIEDIDIPEDLHYPVERGVSITGRYFNDKGKPEKTVLNLVQWKSDNMAVTETDDAGMFEVNALEFYDSTRFFYTTNNPKQREGKIILAERNRPPVKISEVHEDSLILINTESVQRVISAYEVPRETRLLENIEIRAEKISVARQERPYGIARDVNVVSEKDINTSYGDLNYSLIGRVPGLIVQRIDGGWNVKMTRAAGLSANASVEPLVTINDVPMAGSAGDILSMIDPATVKSVEVSKSINVLYGAQGVNGVISVYTKTGEEIQQLRDKSVTRTIVAMGFSSPRKYRIPKYTSKNESESVDLRSGLYWNENFKYSKENQTFSFYTADLETMYHIVIEGVTAENEPIRATYFIKIEN